MKKAIKLLSATMIAGTIVLTGCVSIEDQLKSQSPSVRLMGENRLLRQARLSGNNEEILNAVRRIQTKALLLELAKNANQQRIEEGKLALSKLTDEKDFATLACFAQNPVIRRTAFAKVTEQNTLLAIYTQAGDQWIRKSAIDKLSSDSLSQLPYSSALLPYWKKISNQKTLAKIYRDGSGMFSQEDLNAIAEKIKDESILSEMVIPISGYQLDESIRKRENEVRKLQNAIKELRGKADERNRNAEHAKKNWDFREEKRARREAADLLAKIIPMEKQLELMNNSPVTGLYITNDISRSALYGRITNTDVFAKIISTTDKYHCPLFKTRDQLLPILKNMPEEKALEFVLSKLKKYETYNWNNNDFWALELATSLASVAKDSKTRVCLADMILGKIDSIETECRNSRNFMVRWTDEDKSTAAKYAQQLPLSETEKAEILSKGGLAGRKDVEIAGEETARKVLATGKSFDKVLEEKLVAKIPPEKIDLPLYESVKPGVAKALLYEKMPESIKEAARSSLEKAFIVVEAKAKAARNTTFELAGFYIGMSLDDLKTVLAYHFPRLDFTECRDEDGYEKEKGYGKEFIIVIDSKNLPFCRASAKNRKVYCINFDKTILKNFCKYNAATHRTWAHSYGKERGVTMEYSQLSKEVAVVSGNNFNNADLHEVHLRQDIWQNRDVAKNILITYFGKPNTFTGRGGIEGAFIKGEAWDKLCREGAAPEGTLRAQIDN